MPLNRDAQAAGFKKLSDVPSAEFSVTLNRNLIMWLMVATLSLFAITVQADIYKFIDANGHVAYTNKPRPGAIKLDLTHPDQSRPQPRTTCTPDGCLLRIQRRKDGHFYVPAMINGNSLWFMVDTGATIVAIPKILSNGLGLMGFEPIRLSTANGQLNATLSSNVNISIAGMPPIKEAIAIIPGDMSTPLLGQNILQHYKVILNGDTLELQTKNSF